MDISVFEVIGPVMVGPSSSGTAGMARVGFAAGKFLDCPLKKLNLVFHPRHSEYAGLRSHVALIGGVMGIPEYDPMLKEAMTIAKERGIEVTASMFEEPLPKSGLTVRLEMTQENGEQCNITGISVGGGSIAIIGINDFEVELSSTAKYLFVWSDSDVSDEIKKITKIPLVKKNENKGKYLIYMEVTDGIEEILKNSVQKINSVTKVLFTEPFLKFGYVPHTPLFKTFSELMALSDRTDKDVAELAIEYEMVRSGKTRKEIWNNMEKNLEYMKETVNDGLTKEIKTLFGFGTGKDGKKMMKAIEENKLLGGSTLTRAIAKALATMEMDCSMNRVVAAPTGGSCGIVPGCILTVQEDRNYSDEELVKSLFVAAAAGVCMYFQNASFSGMGGGCQGEIGVSSAIAAAALAYLGGGDTKTVCHAMALSMKNILGLICDRIGGSSEIPCIRRNGIGVANAFSGCDMALAGIESYVTPDEVIEALCNTQKLLPPQLRGGYGGLGCTHTSRIAREIEIKLNKDLTLPKKKES
ncbi:MAG: L-serine ammonia-lyase, iron-sulfur-dependent, subunit alpha [Sedimentibacter sp.]